MALLVRWPFMGRWGVVWVWRSSAHHVEAAGRLVVTAEAD
jgi:hypothetical protein